jgi:hypothetical protein
MPGPAPTVDIDQAAKLRATTDLSLADIAAIQKVTPQAIHKQLQSLDGKAMLDKYKQERADCLAGLQAEIIASVDAATINKARLGERMVAVGVLYDKERLERNQATEIVDHNLIIGIAHNLGAIRSQIEDADVVDVEDASE